MNRLFLLLNQARSATRRRHDRLCQQKLGVSALELVALWALREPTPSTHLAKTLDVDNAAATRLINQLVRKGLAARTSDPSDGRRRLVSRTDDGAAVASGGRDLVGLANAELADTFSPEELDVVARFLRHLISLESR